MRHLTTAEIAILEQQGNYADDWGQVMVTDPFDPTAWRGNGFEGPVSVGAHCSIQYVRRIADYTIGDHVRLFNIGELLGGEVLPAIAVMNENGGRKIRAFAGMTVGDAYLWAKYRGRHKLMSQLQEATNKIDGAKRQAHIGSYAEISNCQRLERVSVLSSQTSVTKILDAVTLKDGIVGYGCEIVRGCILNRFLLGENVHIEDTARITDSVIGDNSTIARCEVVSSLIFPAHEQHHNNSFLIAANIQGQSNIAAGATIGSNHNGRTADGELMARRGFWPGLCSSFKHPSSFASYCLMAKGDYPHELNITLPFALVNNNVAKNQLEVMPAFWWMYNMYALQRNEHKFAQRDHRFYNNQNIVFNPLAPDTAEEILCARHLIQHWTEQSYLRNAATKGSAIEIVADGMERGSRKVVLLKAAKGFAAYEQMLYYYIGQELHNKQFAGSGAVPSSEVIDFAGDRETVWVNMGGQLMRRRDVDKLVADIEQGKLCSWSDIHQRFQDLWSDYPRQKYEHAYKLLCRLQGVEKLSQQTWNQAETHYNEACRYVAQQAKAARAKDLTDAYRIMMYDDDAEMAAVLGS